MAGFLLWLAAVVLLLPCPPARAAGPAIPELQGFPDDAGRFAVALPGGPVATAATYFFQPLGRNGRSCATCHVPSDGYALSAAHAQAAFTATQGHGALFRRIDGAVCPSADMSSLAARQSAYALLTGKGLIRVARPLPPADARQFAVEAVRDPYGCTTKSTLSLYRRPLPTVNLRFLSSITSDGRAPSLLAQAADAALVHEQATAPAATRLAAIVAFESALFAAQSADSVAGALDRIGATGGPAALPAQAYFAGINDPFGGNPTGAPFDTVAMTAFAVWGEAGQAAAVGPDRASIGRGETLFNERAFAISGVAGLNDTLGKPSVAGTCATCHDTPNAGSHSLPQLMDIGVTAASPVGGLDVAGLPVFTLRCHAGPLAARRFDVTDPGQALVTGACADIGKTKVASLRDLAARPPYFHNGGAARLADVVTFYNTRFAIGLSPQEQADLLAFLQAL